MRDYPHTVLPANEAKPLSSHALAEALLKFDDRPVVVFFEGGSDTFSIRQVLTTEDRVILSRGEDL